ncbi:hypothetical protein [Paenibacillus polymyxa]|uniref:hypothetical protein n=1 Tax=Paenibacillus polymyxa TaxID=1406 RepID=UPI00111BC931|nr:hypothetical protein [Paenibacillus polymyxa]QDA30205.1 hypothetical protein FGY93_25130 [Paenibacillus polymyxa]
MPYVWELKEHIQNDILEQLRSKLKAEGLSEPEIEKALDNAFNSKLVDVEHTLDRKIEDNDRM